MSLILDALKKLEREKQTAARGFLVVAPRAWEGPGRGLLFLAGTLGVGLVLGALGLAAVSRWTAAPASPPPTVAAAPVPTPVQLESAPPASTLPPAPSRTGSQAPPTSSRITKAKGNEPPAARPAESGAEEPAVAPSPQTPPGADLPGAGREPNPRTAGPRLQAISQQDGKPVAVIDERLVREGDLIDGMRVVRIGAAEVEIELGGRRQILRF